jgi:hypothetical protein
MHAGGQAVVGAVETRGAGGSTGTKMPCQSPAMSNGRCRIHGGASPGAPKSNRNTFKHRRYTKEAIASRREIAALLRSKKSLVRSIG